MISASPADTVYAFNLVITTRENISAIWKKILYQLQCLMLYVYEMNKKRKNVNDCKVLKNPLIAAECYWKWAAP